MSKSETNFLWNPYTRIAGWQSLCIGFIIMAITAIIGVYNNVVFDGALDVHLNSNLTIGIGLIFMFLDWFVIFVVMAFAAIMMKKQFRIIDLAGTLALARAPFLILAVLGFIATPVTAEEIMSAQEVATSVSEMLPLTNGTIAFMFLTLPIIAWNIALTYNALKVSCDIKGKNLTLLIILGLLVAEVITTLIKMYPLNDYVQ